MLRLEAPGARNGAGRLLVLSSPHKQQLVGQDGTLHTDCRLGWGQECEEDPEPKQGKGWTLKSSEPKPGSSGCKDEDCKAVTKATEERKRRGSFYWPRMMEGAPSEQATGL